MKVPWWTALIAGVAGFALCYLWPAPEPQAVTLRVTDTAYIAQRPDTILRWRDRLVSVQVKPETVTVTRQRFDTVRVERFCKADSTRPILPPFSGRYREGRLELFATRSDGSGWSGIYQAHAPVEWASGDTAVTVKGRRRLPPAVRMGLRLGLCGALGYGVREMTGMQEVALGASGGCVLGTLTGR